MSKLKSVSTSDSFNLSGKEPGDPNRINWVVVSIGLGALAAGLTLLGFYLRGGIDRGFARLEAKIDDRANKTQSANVLRPIYSSNGKEETNRPEQSNQLPLATHEKETQPTEPV